MSDRYHMSSVADQDREESRAAAIHDTTWYRKISGLMYDEDLIPDRSDVEWGDR